MTTPLDVRIRDGVARALTRIGTKVQLFKVTSEGTYDRQTGRWVDRVVEAKSVLGSPAYDLKHRLEDGVRKTFGKIIVQLDASDLPEVGWQAIASGVRWNVFGFEQLCAGDDAAAWILNVEGAGVPA